MDVMGMVFGQAGFTFGLIAFVLATKATNKAAEVEKALIERIEALEAKIGE